MIATGLNVYGKVSEAQARSWPKQQLVPSSSSNHDAKSAAQTPAEEFADENKGNLKDKVLESFQPSCGEEVNWHGRNKSSNTAELPWGRMAMREMWKAFGLVTTDYTEKPRQTAFVFLCFLL